MRGNHSGPMAKSKNLSASSWEPAAIGLGRSLRRHATPYLLIAPAFTMILLVVAYPFANAIWMSLHRILLLRPGRTGFVGLENFRRAFADPVFLESIGNTAVWVVGTVVGQLLIGLIFALVLNEQFAGRGLVRAAVLLPWVTPSVVCAIIFVWLLNGSFGIVNHLLLVLGIIGKPIQWLGDSATALPSAITALVWHGFPFFTIMILAALQVIPVELYEAARVDGAGPWRCFRDITLPLIMPTVLILTLLRTIWVSNHVDIPYVMTGGGPGYSSTTLALYTVTIARVTLDFGYASALSLLLSTVLFAGAAAYFTYLCIRGRGER
jgi:multiple sugar transport system permease protein